MRMIVGAYRCVRPFCWQNCQVDVANVWQSDFRVAIVPSAYGKCVAEDGRLAEILSWKLVCQMAMATQFCAKLVALIPKSPLPTAALGEGTSN